MKKKLCRSIVFSKTPLKSHFRFNDHFLIYPCDFPNAPKANRCDDFPLVIEYWIDEDQSIPISDDYKEVKDFILSNSPQTNHLNRLTRLLSAITNHRISNAIDTGIKWGMPIPEEGNLSETRVKEINNQSSLLFLGLYGYPDIAKDLTITKFSEQRHSDSKFFRHTYYYVYDPIDSKEKEISFPITISDILNKYFSLDSRSRKIIDTVAHLICNGIDLKLKMKSISFLSFVSSIETLVNFEYQDMKDGIEFECQDCQTIKSSHVHCKKCGRPIWGVKAKFKNFLKTYIANGESSEKKYNRIYNLRSSIVHSGILLLGDEQTDWEKSEKAESQWMTHIETMQLARLSLVNWLLTGPKKKMPESK